MAAVAGAGAVAGRELRLRLRLHRLDALHLAVELLAAADLRLRRLRATTSRSGRTGAGTSPTPTSSSSARFYVVGSMAIGLLLAILIDQRVRGEAVWRTIFLYPLAVSFVVTGTVWSWLYNPTSGIQVLVRGLGWTDFSSHWTTDRDSRSTPSSSPASGRPRASPWRCSWPGCARSTRTSSRRRRSTAPALSRIYRRVVLPDDRADLHRRAVVLLQFAIKTFDLVAGADRRRARASPPPSRPSTSTT